jgi:hypothetical protein
MRTPPKTISVDQSRSYSRTLRASPKEKAQKRQPEAANEVISISDDSELDHHASKKLKPAMTRTPEELMAEFREARAAFDPYEDKWEPPSQEFCHTVDPFYRIGPAQEFYPRPRDFIPPPHLQRLKDNNWAIMQWMGKWHVGFDRVETNRIHEMLLNGEENQGGFDSAAIHHFLQTVRSAQKWVDLGEQGVLLKTTAWNESHPVEQHITDRIVQYLQYFVRWATESLARGPHHGIDHLLVDWTDWRMRAADEFVYPPVPVVEEVVVQEAPPPEVSEPEAPMPEVREERVVNFGNRSIVIRSEQPLDWENVVIPGVQRIGRQLIPIMQLPVREGFTTEPHLRPRLRDAEFNTREWKLLQPYVRQYIQYRRERRARRRAAAEAGHPEPGDSDDEDDAVF